MKIAGRTAVITGGASGLGRAAACGLHAAGASVALVDLPGAPGEEAAAALGDRAGFFPADVTSADGLAAALAAAEEAFGAIGIAVNCAGVATIGRVLGRAPRHARTPIPTRIPAKIRNFAASASRVRGRIFHSSPSNGCPAHTAQTVP